MARYNIKTHDGYLFAVSAESEEAAMIIAADRIGRLPLDPLNKYVVYSNIDRKCECNLCELNDGCVHAGCFRRLPKFIGGADECPKLLTKIN